MKILIIGFAKIKFMTYLSFYLNRIDTRKNEVHLIYWNRDNKREDTSHLNELTLHEFIAHQDDDALRLSKIGNFIKFREYARKILKSDKFDLIIVLHTMPGVLLADELRKHYKNRYIYDYRDSTYEFFPPFRSIIAGLVKNARATFVSSNAFRRFLPTSKENHIFTSHNISPDSLSHRNEKQKNGILSDKIRIAFWGIIRHEKINMEIIRKISADERFELHYYGREQQIAFNLKSYVKNNRVKNVFFHGEYRNEERYKFVRKTDIIHNIYHDKNTMLAMGNKYYDGLLFYLPQLCMEGSYMGESCQKHDVGISLNPYKEGFTDRIYEYYKGIDTALFKSKCDEALSGVMEEYYEGEKMLDKCLSFEK